jgi:hypothetical protein
MEGTKLLIRGVAPSAEVKNRIWDQIKLIDATSSDLICDINVSQQQRQPAAQQASATMTAGASVSAGQNQRHYTVKRGDTLSKISPTFMATPISTQRFSTPIAIPCGIRIRSTLVRIW